MKKILELLERDASLTPKQIDVKMNREETEVDAKIRQ